MPHPAALDNTEARTGFTSVLAFLRDLTQLAKPRVTALVIFTFLGGLWLAPDTGVGAWKAALALLGTTLVVAAANAINMYLERDVDGLMRRTQRRPLPQGRLSPTVALAFGCMLATMAIPLMLAGGGLLVTALGLIAFYSYVWGYTPLKRRSPNSLYVGAVPGAMPPLMGWAAATGHLDAGGLALFAVLFLWQIPHFIAIAVYRAADYSGAGFKVMSLDERPRSVRLTTVASTLLLVLATLAFPSLGVAGWVFGAGAAALGLVFLAMTAGVYRVAPGSERARRWAKSVFLYSLLYLTALFVLLGVDRALQ